ncbi:MAG: hypothetical protein KDA71_06915, partial [Planctomycetales bacterium]|nr:hypothetical protein [Planctomycetales bacterium]
MERMNVVEAGRQLDDLVSRITRDGVTIELEQDNTVVARLVPVPRRLCVADLNRLFAELPRLGDDAESFAVDVQKS